ncbi:MAG: ABC-F family ATP-binding cassette domain-containing protein [Desulforegulaceae bacterium]|nr:ABC-F family ATP-binding cassette domain-containing protein [Desulforegulaceae bacterium]
MSYLMNLLNIEKTYGFELLFENFSLGIEKGDKIGIIGPNGAGKSTLLKIISGLVSPDNGEINRVKGLNCEYLDQDPDFEDSFIVGNIISSSIEKSLEKNPGKEGEIRKVTGLSGMSEYDDTKVGLFSGGMKKRLALTCAMMQLPDILLLDEPTNHLDLNGIEWLENMLNNSGITYMSVTHDREFLNNCADKIIEISPVFPGSHFIVEGNFETFLNKKDLFLQNQSDKVLSLANKMRREDDWLSRSPKARTTKAKFRIDKAYELKDELSQTRSRDNVNLSPEIEFESTGRKTKRLVSAKEISKSFNGKTIIDNFSIVLQRNDRVSILGANGSGKTTLVDMLSGQSFPDKGKIDHVENLKIIYFDQKRAFLDKSKTPKEILAPDSDSVIVKNRKLHIISWLKKFGIAKEQINQPVHSLSGGEQARVLMADLIRTPCDLIFLDEPTNDLDIPTIEMLEDALLNFEGCVVAVTHDRYFAKAIGSKYVGINNHGKLGIYHELGQWQEELAESEKKTEKKEKKKTQGKNRLDNKPRKLSYKYQLELDTMEEKILENEELISKLEIKASDTELMKKTEDYIKVCEDLKKAQEKNEALYERWGYLESLELELKKD